MTGRWVTPETLAAALPGLSFDYGGVRVYLALWQPDLGLEAIVSAEMGYWLRLADAILAAIPPDPRLDALLAAAREVERTWGIEGMAKAAEALSDALAAFEEKV